MAAMHDGGTPDLPPELRLPAPRPVRLTMGGFMVSATAVALIAAALGGAVWLPVLAVRQAARRAQFDRQAVTGEAEILTLGPRKDQGRRAVAYRYDAGGRTWTGRVTLRRGQWSGLRPGSRVPVRYLPSDPGVSYLASGPGVLPPWAVPAMIVPLALGGMALGWGVRGQRKLLSEGRGAVARVTASRRSHHGRHRVEFRFRTLSGAFVTAATETRRRPLPDYLIVVYDPERPRRAAPYPLPLARIGRS